MSRDWDEERPRRRRQDDDDYEDIGRPRRAASGSVTSVGVITIILGSLTLLCGLCFTIFGIAFAGGAAGAPRGAGFLPFQMAAGILVVMAIIVLILGALYLVGGIGVLQRRNWGRIMTLVMAGFSGLFGVLQIVGGIVNLAQQGPAEGKVIALLVNLLIAALFFTHCVMSFVVLLSAQNAAEFE
jgi:hypothetical protein